MEIDRIIYEIDRIIYKILYMIMYKYPTRLYIIHYTEVKAPQRGSHPKPIHYKIYTL